MFFRNRRARPAPEPASGLAPELASTASDTSARASKPRQHPAAHVGAFTRSDLDLLLAMYAKGQEFEQFVLDRFGVYTRSVDVRDTTSDKPVPAVTSFVTYGGAEYWHVQPNWLDVLTRTLKDPTVEPFIPVQHYVAGDRGPGKIDFRVHVPLSFIFAEST